MGFDVNVGIALKRMTKFQMNINYIFVSAFVQLPILSMYILTAFIVNVF